jgi:hypothetical protein
MTSLPLRPLTAHALLAASRPTPIAASARTADDIPVAFDHAADRLDRWMADNGERARRHAVAASVGGLVVSGLAGLGMRMAFGPAAELAAAIPAVIGLALTCTAVSEFTGGLRDSGEMIPVGLLPFTACMGMAHATHPLIGIGLLAAGAAGFGWLSARQDVLEPSHGKQADELRALADKYRHFAAQRKELGAKGLLKG